MKYLLDANAVIGLLNDAKSLTARRVRRQKPGDIGVSAIVLHELYYGAYKSERVARNVAAVDALRFSVVDFDEQDARHAGELRALLRARGTPIGPYDVLIAGQAKARRLTLVTRNTEEFARVPDLRLENWEISPAQKAFARCDAVVSFNLRLLALHAPDSGIYAARSGAMSCRLTGATPNSRSTRLNAVTDRAEGAVISTPMARPSFA